MRKHHQCVDKRRATQAIYKKKAESKMKRRKLSCTRRLLLGMLRQRRVERKATTTDWGLIFPKEEDEDEEKIKQIVIGCEVQYATFQEKTKSSSMSKSSLDKAIVK
jgi:hypothetical protein